MGEITELEMLLQFQKIIRNQYSFSLCPLIHEETFGNITSPDNMECINYIIKSKRYRCR